IASEARQAAAIAGAAVLGGRRKAWVEFRRGPLAISDPLRVHRSALDGVVVAAAIVLVCLSVGLVWRASRDGRAAVGGRDGSARARMRMRSRRRCGGRGSKWRYHRRGAMRMGTTR